MSTFNGQVVEFPDIRVDFFRPSEGSRPALACFLSHVHSDHLSGLESFKGPFVYCSAATREILLRLERFPHRFNFQKGLLESRKQTYRHLKYLLKPLPLETPTTIELAPGKKIRVTLFDANHCTGAVMFLIEGDNKAVLYTGDIRSEPWHVNNLRRNPILLPYTSELKKLDCIYLDTTFTDDIHFPTKAEGLAELLNKIALYPLDTHFHFKAWTFGYEEVWIALSAALNSSVHVDEYKLGLYKSLCPDQSKPERPANPTYLSAEAAALIGHWAGNKLQDGCLTLDQSARIHSCELSLRCPVLKRNTVFIQPILARGTNGVELLEVGAGGGEGDLTRHVELEFESDKAAVERLLEFLKHGKGEHAETMKADIMKKVKAGRRTVALEDLGLIPQSDDLSMEELIKLVAEAVPRPESQAATEADKGPAVYADDELPRLITFPYSRHSSYQELCELVAAFKPADVYPCTVDERRWFSGVTMGSLFGHCCDEGTHFRHDSEMSKRYGWAEASQQSGGEARIGSISALIERPGVLKRKAEEELTADNDRFSNANRLSASYTGSHSASDDPAANMAVVDPQSANAVSVWTGYMLEPDNPDGMDLNAHKTDENSCENCQDRDWLDQEMDVWDPVDGVLRCRSCLWERWLDAGSTASKESQDSFLPDALTENGYELDSMIDDGPEIEIETEESHDPAPPGALTENGHEIKSMIDDGPRNIDLESIHTSDTELDFEELQREALIEARALRGLPSSPLAEEMAEELDEKRVESIELS